MRWPFSSSKRRQATRAREVLRDLKVLESQQALLEAATQTADAANFVTNRLRSKLQDSLDQIESTARIINDALVICDIEGKVQAFNPAAENLFKTDAASVLGQFVGVLLESSHRMDFGTDVWTLLKEIDEAEEAHDLNGRRPGGTFPLDVNHTRLDRTDGTAIVLMVMRDLSPAEDGVKLKSYRSVFESSFDGILVIKGRSVVAANPAATKLFGYNKDELLTKTLGSLFPTENLNSEIISAKHRDGHKMDMLFTTTMILWDGEPASLLTVKDISAADIKPESEAMICCFDNNFCITYANGAYANFYGLKKDGLIGTDIRKILPAEECDPFLINIASLTPDEPTRRMKLRSGTPDGQQRLQVWTDHACYDGNVEYQRIGRDISETITSKAKS